MAKGFTKETSEIFLVNVTVLEGRNYAWPNIDSYVHLRVGKQQAQTGVRHSTDAPFYNEYFVFQFETNLNDILDQYLTITVYKAKGCCKRRKLLGYVNMDVNTVWEEVDHQFYRKWAILSSPKSDAPGVMGYLKLTISILSEGQVPKIPIVNPLTDNLIQGNVLLPDGVTSRKRALFIFKIYRGYDIIKKNRDTSMIETDKPETELTKCEIRQLPNVSVKITFAGLTISTTRKRNTSYPVWNESLTVAELYPPLTQRIRIDLQYKYSGCKRVSIKKYIHMYTLCDYKEIGGWLPTFGPSYLHFYKPRAMGEEYVGKILVALQTKVFTETQTKTRCTFWDTVPPVFNSSLWKIENIFLFVSLASVSVIDKRFANSNISFELNWGRMQVMHDAESQLQNIPNVVTPDYKPRTRNKEFWYLEFGNLIPCMHIVHNYPNLRRRMFRANRISRIIDVLAEKLSEMRLLFKSDVFISYSKLLEEKLTAYLDYLSAACESYVDVIHATGSTSFETELDAARSTFIVKEMQDIMKKCKTAYYAPMKKRSFRTCEKFYQRLVRLVDFPQECWPDVFLWMKNGNRKSECLKLEARDVVYSNIPEERGKYSGQLNNFYFMTNRSSKSSSPVVCKIELFVWLGLESQKNECYQLIPQGFKVPEEHEITSHDAPMYLELNDFIIFHARVHIYQGRFVLAFDYTGLSDFCARVIIHDQVKSTQAREQTLSPVWDETLIMRDIICFGTKQQIQMNPPSLVLEVNDKDKWSLEYVGFCLVTPVIKFSDEPYDPPKFPPKLKWHQIKHGDTIVGDVLAVIEFIEKSDDIEDLVGTQQSIPIPDGIRPALTTYRFEILIWGVRHVKKLQHYPIRNPKIVVECSEYVIETSVASIAHLNFSPIRHVADFQLPIDTEMIPPVTLKLFECRNRCLYAGTHLSFLQEFLYNPITMEEFRSMRMQPVHRSLESIRSKTSSEIDVAVEKLKRRKKRRQKLDELKWRFRLIFNVSNFRGLCILCTRGSWRCFKKMLRFLCCLLLCCGCGRMFKRKKVAKGKLVGADPEKFLVYKDTVLDMDKSVFEDVTDWWNKYFNSLGDPYSQLESAYDKNFRMKVYDSELENQPNFHHFADLLTEMPLYRGKTTGYEYEDEKAQIATVKCKIRVYEWDEANEMHQNYVTPKGNWLRNGYFQIYPSNEITRFVVRVYCVRASKLKPADNSGACDSYLVVRMNTKLINDKKNHVPRTSNPFFGRCYEMEGEFPTDNTITISAYDWDRCTKADLIGMTKIDIENRFYTRHHATCGLPTEYTLFGNTPWRDAKDPTEILNELCDRCNIPLPQYEGPYKVHVGGKTFTMPEDEQKPNETEIVKREMVALLALNKWHEIPVVGFHLVPEHVETRSLYHPDMPGIEQGKLQLWVDIFPFGEVPLPHQVNIKTRKPVTYQLRVIIWNTESVQLNEDDFFGDRKTDIFVKGWINSAAEAQKTDVHFRSMTGEGNFNWRFVFDFDYLSAENVIVYAIPKKAFEIERKMEKRPCRLTLQVWDDDVFSKDDFIGSLTIYLNRMPRGAKVARQCTLKNFEAAPRMNLFTVKRTRGWWPFEGKSRSDPNKIVCAGKVEAEFELLTKEQARIAPAGEGREPPLPLAEPKRPMTSFNWLMNPWKTFRFVIWKNLKWKLLFCFLIVLVTLFFSLFLYSVPSNAVRKLLHV